MKKIIYVLVLLMTFCILYGEKRIVSEVANSGTFTTVTTENVTSILDKYFSDFEFGNKKAPTSGAGSGRRSRGWRAASSEVRARVSRPSAPAADPRPGTGAGRDGGSRNADPSRPAL